MFKDCILICISWTLLIHRISNNVIMAYIAKFHSELDGLELHFPGQQIIQFSNDDVLQRYMHHQYPDWEKPGNVSSIPIGRLPRVFLSSDQIIDSLTKRFASLQKGEDGEIKTYKYLLEWGKTLSCGICLFPNLDGNHFETIESHVEIDMTIVHPEKGIFVFSIKNASCIKERDLVKGMLKHVAFIRTLCTYKQNVKVSDTSEIPIHGIICSFQVDIERELLEKFQYFQTSEGEVGGRFLLQPNDMNAIYFPSKLTDILATIPSIEDRNTSEGIHVMVSRLAALNSFDSSLVLIHKQIETNNIQTIRVKSNEVANILEKQFPDDDTTTQVKKVLSADTEGSLLREHVRNDLKTIKPASGKGKNKKSIILWSKEQLDIIHHVGKTLFTPNKGCRILVTGPKGSGKTVIMIYLAKLAKSIFSSHEYSDERIAIYDGRFGYSQILFDSLRKKYAGSGIDVLTCKPDSKNNNSSKYSLIMIDEMNSLSSLQLFWLDYKYPKNQKVIIFSSYPNLQDSFSEFQHFKLSKTLRSTCSITKFCEDFRCFDPNCMMFPAVTSHNLVGTPPDLKCISVNSDTDPTHNEFVNESVSVIMNILEKAKGLHDILVTPFIYPVTLHRIMREIAEKGLLYQYVNPADVFHTGGADRSTGSRSVPGITFVTGNHMDGAEYGAVIVLIDRCLPCFFDDYIFDSVYIAITRATVLLSIVVNDSTHPPVILEKSRSKNWGSLISEMPKSNNLYAYNCSTEITSKDLSTRLEEIIDTIYCKKSPILLVGDWKIPSEFYSIEQRDALNKEKIFWFCGPNEELLVWCPDLTKFSLYLRNNLISVFSCFAFSIQDKWQFNPSDFDRHQLFYLMWQNNIFQSPMYIFSPSKLTKSDRKCSFLICDFIKTEAPLPHSGLESSQRSKSNQAENLKKVDPAIERFENGSADKLSTQEFVQLAIDLLKGEKYKSLIGDFTLIEPCTQKNWQEMKQIGNKYFKEDNLCCAFMSYEGCRMILKAQYDEVLPTADVSTLIKLAEELAKVHTNISKVCFEISNKFSKCDDQDLFMRISLENADQSIKVDPTWAKGYHRLEECNGWYGKNNLSVEIKDLSGFTNEQKLREKRFAMLKAKMSHCTSWHLVRNKENVYLIDVMGNGHFSSLDDALLKNFGDRHAPISFLLNPGKYKNISISEFEFELLLQHFDNLDIIGNCDPPLDHEKKWVLHDLPVTIVGKFICRLGNENNLSLSRVSIESKEHAVLVDFASDVCLHQCSFKTQIGASVACRGKSRLKIDGCRFFDSYGGLVAGDGSSVHVQNTFFQKVRFNGVEFREVVSGTVEHCFFTLCGGSGLQCLNSDVIVKSCVFENNNLQHFGSESSVYCKSSIMKISDTHVSNQIGFGLILQYGSCELEALYISECNGGGIFIEDASECAVRNCIITNCRIGVYIHQDMEDVKLEGNIFNRCMKDIDRDPPNTSNPIAGQFFNEQVLKNREHISAVRDLQTGRADRFCEHCSLIADSLDCRSCPRCEAVIYCSEVCYVKDKVVHDKRCKNMQKDMEAYTKSKKSKKGKNATFAVETIENNCGWRAEKADDREREVEEAMRSLAISNNSSLPGCKEGNDKLKVSSKVKKQNKAVQKKTKKKKW